MAEPACPCGASVASHERNPAQLRHVYKIIMQLGPLVLVETPAGKWMVPRLYIALHSITADQLPSLAERYGWAKAG